MPAHIIYLFLVQVKLRFGPKVSLHILEKPNRVVGQQIKGLGISWRGCGEYRQEAGTQRLTRTSPGEAGAELEHPAQNSPENMGQGQLSVPRGSP